MSQGQIIQGDCMEVLPTLPAGSVHCVVTSPPYFALRSYLPQGHELKAKEIGSEPTPDAFIATMVAVFREVRRVLRDDGVCFINLGDSYGSSGGPGTGPHPFRESRAYQQENVRNNGGEPGQLLNIPHRVAEALRADGWIWRQTIVWAKRSPMPESVNGWRWVKCKVKVATAKFNRDRLLPGRDGQNEGHRDCGSFASDDNKTQWTDCPGCPKCAPNGGYVLRKGSGRCTTAHEYIFVMAKAGGYFWDGEESKETAEYGRSTEIGAKIWNRSGVPSEPGRTESTTVPGEGGSRNPRSVWMLSSEPTKIRHFATFPSELVRRCLSAGISAGGCCEACGSPYAPVVESVRVATRPGEGTKIKIPAEWDTGEGAHGSSNRDYLPDAEIVNRDPERHVTESKVAGYRPTCNCISKNAGCVVLDPFSGIGTVAQTARQVGARWIGIELNPAYVKVSLKYVQLPPRWWLRERQETRVEAEEELPLLAEENASPLDVERSMLNVGSSSAMKANVQHPTLNVERR